MRAAPRIGRARAWLSLALAIAAGCESGRTPPPAAAPALAGLGEGGRFHFAIALDPAAPRLGERFAAEVRIRDRAGAPVDAELWFDATMPEHGHGMQTAPVRRRLGPGRFRAEGLRFHMPGRWTFELRARAAGAADAIRLRYDQPP